MPKLFLVFATFLSVTYLTKTNDTRTEKMKIDLLFNISADHRDLFAFSPRTLNFNCKK